MSAPARRFELDAKAERSVGRLRLVGAIIVFVCGGVLVARGAGAVGWTLVVMAWLVGLGWIAAFVRARRRVAGAGGHYLELGDALRMARGAAPVEVPWGEVDAVRVDEDRLVVV
ncbi:MAG: hypothetical protein CMH59_14140, partial [Myxococcales bacterium]|nr:hypothetical protein [Myxococcales bacterium]